MPSPDHLSELMSLLAHDLRNPLSALLTNVNFIRAALRGRAPELEEALADSALSCTMLGQVIGNLDVLSRAFSPPSTSRYPMSLRQAAEQAVGRFAAQAQLVGASFEIAGVAQGATVLVDPGFFARSLDNLLANSLQYATAGGKVRIECETAADRGVLAVLDEGPPVPVELRAAALTAEGQGIAKLRHEARYGRGLGLYCAAEAARIAGAEVRLDEREGRSVLALIAPVAEREATAAR